MNVPNQGEWMLNVMAARYDGQIQKRKLPHIDATRAQFPTIRSFHSEAHTSCQTNDDEFRFERMEISHFINSQIKLWGSVYLNKEKRRNHIFIRFINHSSCSPRTCWAYGVEEMRSNPFSWGMEILIQPFDQFYLPSGITALDISCGGSTQCTL